MDDYDTYYRRRDRGRSFSTGFWGAILGALSAFLAISLANKNNRKTIEKVFDTVRKHISDTIEDLRQKAVEVKDETKKLVKEKKEETKMHEEPSDNV